MSACAEPASPTNDRHPPSRRNPRRRCGRLLAPDGGGEGGTLQGLKAIRSELIDPTISAHNGRLVKTTSDGFLVEFSSVVDTALTPFRRNRARKFTTQQRKI